MQYYFAPLEGITGYLYRNIHHKHFPGIDRYYSPFVVTRDGGIMKRKELRDILPENNREVTLIMQRIFCALQRQCMNLVIRK